MRILFLGRNYAYFRNFESVVRELARRHSNYRAVRSLSDWLAAAGVPGIEGLDIPVGGESILFVDCEAAFYRTSLPRAER